MNYSSFMIEFKNIERRDDCHRTTVTLAECLGMYMGLCCRGAMCIGGVVVGVVVMWQTK